MQIILLDNNKEMCNAWKKFFKDTNVDILCTNIAFADIDVECYVSPGNSYGLMDGGYDLALTMLFGKNLQKNVQNYIINNLYCEQPVGSSIIVDIPNTNKKLIHTPTMKIPSPIIDTEIIYTCMRSTLICALNNNINSIIIPAFGGRTGMVKPDDVAKMMYLAYNQIINRKEVHSWQDLW